MAVFGSHRRLYRQLCCTLWCLACTAAQAAGGIAEKDVDPVLLALVAQRVAQAPLRDIDSAADRGAAVAPQAPPPGQGVASVRNVASVGGSRIVLLLDLGHVAQEAEGYAVLALIELALPGGQPRLLDAAQVARDRHTSFFDPATLRPVQGESVVLVASSHSNSSQSYQTVSMLGLSDDKLQLIDTVFTFGDSGCGYARTQRPTFATRGQAIRVQITESVRHTGPACRGERRPAAGQRSVAVTYRWQPDAGEYRKSSHVLEQWAREMEGRF
jgi:hypothetical protein